MSAQIRIGLMVVCLTSVFLNASASSASNDEAICDRLAASAQDLDKPSNVEGVSSIAKPDIQTAVDACQRAAAAANSNRRFQSQLGRALEFAERPGDAAAAYRKAAAAGSAEAMTALGVLYAQGSGVKQDYAEAKNWFEKGAGAGHVLAMSNLASLHGGGLGVPKDMAIARRWFEKAAAANYNEAMFQLGLMAQDGDGGPKDNAAAKIWFEKAAALDHPDAIFMLGEYAQKGIVGTKDKMAAIKFYARAAKMGNEDAQQAFEQLRCSFEGKDPNGNTIKICMDP